MNNDPIPHRRFLPVLVLLAAAFVFPLRLPAGNILIVNEPDPGQGLPTTVRFIAEAAGHNVFPPPGTSINWSAMTTEDFAAYDAIVIDDCICSLSPSVLDFAVENRDVWSPAIQGNIVIMGNTPISRIDAGDPLGRAEQLIRNAINFAASGNGTGLYLSLSYYYSSFTSKTPVEALGGLGDFRVLGAPGLCPDSVVVAEPGHPVMAGLTDAGLSNWGCSMYEYFTAFPASYTVLATETGRPYIIATGMEEVVVTVQTNPADNPSIGPPSANIVRGDGADQTTLYISLDPPRETTVSLSADFGSVPTSAQTDADGKATATYTSGMAPTDATTTIAPITATVSGNQGATEVYNFRGFQEYDFRQTQVSDARFIAYTEWGESEVQAFFVARNSFLACFYLVGTAGDRGFWDTDCNGFFNWVVDVKYCADLQDPDCALNGPKISAAQAIVNAARKQGQRVNPKLLLVQLQKEKSLISQTEWPGASLLNDAFGCDTLLYPNFGKQLNCGAKTMAQHFNSAPTMPFFFSLVFLPTDFLRHWVYQPQAGISEPRPVAFTLSTKATYALYRYTPWVAATQGGGGNYLFEQIWKQYAF